MRLINFGPGEIADRLSILALKIQRGKEAGKDVKHFVDERNALLTQLRSRELNGNWFEHVLDLAAVNAGIWQGEDELREFRACADSLITVPLMNDVITTAFRLQALNDRRHELITLINVNTGDHVGAEKV